MNSDPLDQLRKLAALREEGVIDEFEYDRLKKQYLSQAETLSGQRPTAVISGPPTPPLPPLGDPSFRAPRVSERQVNHLHTLLSEFEKEFSKLQKQKLGRVDRERSLQRRLKHLARVAAARRLVENVPGQPLTPVLVMTLVGILLGVVSLELFSNIPGAMLIGGLSGGTIALLVSLNLFVTPSNSSVALERSGKQAKLVAVQTELARDEPAFVDAGAKLNVLRNEYAALLADFKHPRNHFLLLEWRGMSGRPFEVFLKDVFEFLGYRCRMVEKTSENGIDLIVEKDGPPIAILARANGSPVEAEAVRQAFEDGFRLRCNECAVITNSRFTPAAIEFARKNKCKLIDETQIEALLIGEAGV